MSYQVLARKWRPKRFPELVGQSHVVRALTHALDSGRIHHAFLFSGTRGVGKTTIARIFAKSLNCETGTSANPCGQCSACIDIDAGRYLDLIEIDAASNTGVDDVRVVIENAQYAPTRGRYKVYLIDEVHMLSKSAFNALLKTLEEPPPHVKFLLATTDPQKLPVTVLSRCLNFNLRRLGEDEIARQLQHVLTAEAVPFDAGAIAALARAGNGSMRDALSLTDQAIAYGGGRLIADEVRAMLGTVDTGRISALLSAIADDDASTLYARIAELAEYAPDFGILLDEIAALLHQMQLAQWQLVPVDDDGAAGLLGRLTVEETQLLYQIAIHGRRDLHLAPNPRAGFEMTLLRMLAFRPAADSSEAGAGAAGGAKVAATAGAGRLAAPLAMPGTAPPGQPAPAAAVAADKRAADALTSAHRAPHAPLDLDRWAELLAALDLRGPVRELAYNAVPLGWADGRLRLGLSAQHEPLRTEGSIRQLAEALAGPLGGTPRLVFEIVEASETTLAAQARRQHDERQRDAEAAVASDPVIARLLADLDARILPGSIRPVRSN